MNQSGSQDNKPPVSYMDIGMQAMTVGGEVGCMTVLIVLGAVLGGLWLDRALGTKPLLTVLFVLASAPLALFLTYKLAKRAVEPKQPPKNGGEESKP